MTDLHVRPAAPGDVDAVVPLMLASSPELIAATFGAGAGTVVRRDFLRGRGIFGYAHQLVGVAAGGRVVGSVTAYRGRDYRRLGLRTLVSAAALGPRGLTTTVRRMTAMADLFTPPAPDGLFVANLCVAPAGRGQGYGTVLLEYLREVARARNLSALELDVSYSNARAQRLYERLGFVVAAERPAPDGSALDGFRRMRRPTTPE